MWDYTQMPSLHHQNIKIIPRQKNSSRISLIFSVKEMFFIRFIFQLTHDKNQSNQVIRLNIFGKIFVSKVRVY